MLAAQNLLFALRLHPASKTIELTKVHQNLPELFESVETKLVHMLDEIPPEKHVVDQQLDKLMIEVTNRMEGHNWRVNVE